jgi:hypothetical protein
MEFNASQVWGCAVAADRINGGYFKEPVWDFEQTPAVVKTDANKLRVKQWLRTGDFSLVTAADTAAGEELRNFFNGYTLKALTGQISDFDKQALRIAQMDTFTGKHMLEFAIVSCLPSAARRERERNDIKREVYHSDQLPGAVGDAVVGDFTVVSCSFSQMYNKFKLTGRIGESFVDFWYGSDMEKGTTLRIKGKIKQHRGNNTTQLNYVKKA